MSAYAIPIAPFVAYREEFRTPAGVGKSPRNEPAVSRGLYGDLRFMRALELERRRRWGASWLALDDEMSGVIGGTEASPVQSSGRL
jgi:hypothetical protein